jgi:tetratricopeptide (TPR) repeat protein
LDIAGNLLLLAGDNGSALAMIERALTLNPNSAEAWWTSSALNNYLNRPEQALSDSQRAIRLSPLDPNGYSFKQQAAFALMLAGRHDEALEWIDRSLQERPNTHTATRMKVAILGHLHRHDEARDWVRRLRALNPEMTIAWWRSFARAMSPGAVAVWEEGLRRAGLPEE